MDREGGDAACATLFLGCLSDDSNRDSFVSHSLSIEESINSRQSPSW
jgi:hypothetical protein